MTPPVAERQQHSAIKAVDSGLSELNAARAALGLPPLDHVIDQLDFAEAAARLGAAIDSEARTVSVAGELEGLTGARTRVVA